MEVSAENNHRPTTHPQYRQIALIICIGVLFVGIFDYFTGAAPSSLFRLKTNARFSIFCMALMLLCGLELIRWRTPQLMRPAIHLILMLLFSGLALATSRHHYSQLLLLTSILFAELTFPRWVAVLTIVTNFLLLFVRSAFGPNNDFLSTFDQQALLIFTVLTLLIWLMARLIKSEWSNRLHLQTLHNELQETSMQLAQMAVVEERNRMARDIHDSVGHHLAAVSIQLEMAAKLHQSEPNASVAAIHEAKAATHDALHDVRLSVGTLRGSAESFALVPAVEVLIGRISSEQLSINYHLDGDESLYPQPARLVFYRAIQEGLTNVFKHATASHVNLWLQFLPKQARLRIIDDGIGFDTQQKTNGTGLQGVRERVEGLGGKLMIESRPDEGTILDIILPQTTS